MKTVTATATNDTSTWLPEKAEYEDDEIKLTPIFQRLKNEMGVKGPGGKIIHLPDENVIPIARDYIKEVWAAVQASRHGAVILAVFESFDEAGLEHGGEVILRRGEDGSPSYKLTKTGSRKRFSHEGYARLIDFGTDETTDLYKAAAEKLKKSGHGVDVLHGGFLLVKSQMKNPKKNGVFELVISQGNKDNKLCDAITVTLYQYPDDKASVPNIVFPPASGDKGKLVVDDETTEVPSLSQMMRNSILQGAQTPAVMFDLIKELKALGEDVSDLEEGEAASEESNESAEETETKAKTSTQKRSAGRSLLDE